MGKIAAEPVVSVFIDLEKTVRDLESLNRKQNWLKQIFILD